MQCCLSYIGSGEQVSMACTGTWQPSYTSQSTAPASPSWHPLSAADPVPLQQHGRLLSVSGGLLGRHCRAWSLQLCPARE